MKLALALSSILLLHFNSSFAANYMPGDTRVIPLEDKPTAVVIGSPQIADYRLVEDGVVLVAKSTGRTSFKVIGEGNKLLYSEKIQVGDEVVINAVQLAKSIDPSASISVKRTASNGWYISGRTSNEDKKEQICNSLRGYLGDEKITTEKFDINTFDAEAQRFRNGSVKMVCAIKTLNNRSKLINVGVKIVEVSSSKRESLGISWSDFRTMGDGLFVVGKGINPTDGIFGLISALVEDSSSNVIAEPNMTVLSGEKAFFRSGGELSVVTKDDEGEATVTFREYGTTLNIGAEVVDDSQIRLLINTGNSTLDPSNTYITEDGARAPALRTQNMSTVLNVQDGQTFAIGGMTSSSTITKDKGIPFLSSIPYVSSFFKTTQDENERKELIVLVTVKKAFTESISDMTIQPASNYVERLLSVRLNKHENEVVFAPYVQ